jgi:hypothetical protein
MANNIQTAVDPLGKIIFLLPGICIPENKEHEIYDDVAKVIQKPAILVEAKESNETMLYYFRSIGWYNTLLINVEWKNDRWEMISCVKNPSSENLSVILKKGRQII